MSYLIFNIIYFLNGNCSFFSPHLIVEKIKLSILEDELLPYLHVDTNFVGFLHKAAKKLVFDLKHLDNQITSFSYDHIYIYIYNYMLCPFIWQPD